MSLTRQQVAHVVVDALVKELPRGYSGTVEVDGAYAARVIISKNGAVVWYLPVISGDAERVRAKESDKLPKTT